MLRARPAVLVALLVLLTGCSSSDGSTGAGPAGDDVRASEAPQFPPDSVLDVEKPASPELGDEITVKAAGEYAEYLLAEFRYGLRTSYLDNAARGGGAPCEFCAVWGKAVDDFTEREWLVEAEPFEIASLTPRPDLPVPLDGTGVVLDLVVEVPALDIVDAGGREIGTVPESRWETRFTLQRRYGKVVMTWPVLSTDLEDGAGFLPA